MRITDKHVFFYRDWLSNYQRTSFEYEVNERMITFSSTEQAFMYIKANMFGDQSVAAQILATNNPNECRKLGRKVQGYDEKVWDACRYFVFYELNLAKYTQDKNLRNKLLDPIFDGKTFVEASPIDRIWGVGLDENNPLIDDPSNWKGKNLLGNILTKVRQRLIDEITLDK